MKKILFYGLIVCVAIELICNLQTFAMINPWIDCNDDISCGAKKAGFNFPLRVKGYSVRAMKDMIEIQYPFDKKRTVTIRKSQTYLGDNSGVYNNYPINKTLDLKNGVMLNVRGDKKHIYLTSFAGENGYYSIYCEKGLSQGDIKKLYEIIIETEIPLFISKEKESSIEELQELRRKDGVVEPVYTQDCFPRTLEKMGVTKNCFERANLGQNTACSISELKMIKEYYKKGYKCDPLNDGSGNFCAEE